MYKALALALLLVTASSNAERALPTIYGPVPNMALLTWDEAPSGSLVIGYRVYYGLQPRTYSQPPGSSILVNGPKATSYVATGLPAGQVVYFAVTAISAYSESEFSTDVSKLIK